MRMRTAIAIALTVLTFAPAAMGDLDLAPGTAINFGDGTSQSTAGGVVAPSDHGGTGCTVSGTAAFVGGGNANTASNSYATVCAGTDNVASGESATVGGGDGNRATAFRSTVAGGYDNEASEFYATVGGGWSNTASYNTCTVGGGSTNLAHGYHATVGGGYTNQATAYAATVAGGRANYAQASYATIAGGGPTDPGNPVSTNNRVTDEFGTIGGGGGNLAGDNAGEVDDKPYCTVSGGYNNEASGEYATVGGGYANTASGNHATVGGGYGNSATAFRSTVAGGYDNEASEFYATVGGGWSNTASYNTCTVGGGSNNTASGYHAVVAGGYENVASGYSSCVPGGRGNQAAASYSFAAGRRAKVDASHSGAMLFADSTDANFSSAQSNEFAVRASGGVYLYTNTGLTSGSQLAAGSGSWSSVSAREAKENFEPVDPKAVLSKVVQMSVETWNYKSQPESIRHMGPMAEDFRAAFEVGDFEGRITAIDADGVALAAIQGLHQEVEEDQASLRQMLAQRDATIQSLRETVEALAARLEALEKAGE